MKLSVIPRIPSVATEVRDTHQTWLRATDLNVIAIYDGLAGGIRVQETFEWLRRTLNPGVKLFTQSWSFSSLARLDMRAAAVHEAADADLLCVAAEPAVGLPASTVSWIDRCEWENSCSPVALVALHETDDTTAGRDILTRQLQGIAARWHMEYISNSELDIRLNLEGVHDLLATEYAMRSVLPWAFALPAMPETWHRGPLDD